MNITLGELAESVIVLEQIKNQSTDFKVSYWIMRNMKILSESFNFFIASREQIYSKYCNKVVSGQYPDGSYFTILKDGTIKFHLKNDVDVSHFDKEMYELMNLPCNDMHPYLLSPDAIDKIADIKLNTDNMFIIDYLLAE